MVFIVRQGTFVAGHPHVAPSYTRMYRLSTPGCTDSLHPDVKDGNMGVFTELSACLWQKKRGLLWNEEPYFADLIPVIFIFTFVYSIILYAFSKAYRIQHTDYQ